MTEDYEVYKEGSLLRGRYKKLDDISEGSYGYVSLANDTQTKKLVAVKYIFKSDSKSNDSSNHGSLHSRRSSSGQKHEELQKHQKSLISDKVRSRLSKNICFEALYEVEIHTKVGKHKNITELYDYFDSFIIMEYCSGGDMYEAIRADLVPKKTRLITHIASQLMEAIEFVHAKGIYHRDVKPENILIAGSDWTIKLTDWGLATKEKTSMDRSVGSERYMSPELFEENLDRDERSEPYDCSKVDLWAIGIVLLNVVFHKNPFSVANQSDKSFCYFAANREALFDIFSTMSFDFFQVLRHSLTMDPSNRDLASMKRELAQLGEYTLDDEYYNSLTEDGYSSSKTIEDSATPMSTSTTPTVPDEITVGKVPQISVEEITPAASIKHESKEKDPVPRFRFRKRSHPQRDEANHKNIVPIKIDDSKILKNSRKPLAIPTPNTHINNFFHDYHEKEQESFNTRDFFTPPSVHNRYMEGIFNNKSNKHRGHRNRRPSSNGAQRLTPKANGNHLSTSYGRRGSNPSQNSPSGKYIPPHSRPSSLHNGSPNIPTICSVLDGVYDSPTTLTANTYHEQHAIASDNNENDLDDVLFTLEENDIDSFTNDVDGLSINDETLKKSPNTVGVINDSVRTGDLPELLKSPVLESAKLNDVGRTSFLEQIQQQEFAAGPAFKPKPGVYIPPHHRKSMNADGVGNRQMSPHGVEATLSVNHNSVSYGGFNTRRKSSSISRAGEPAGNGKPFLARNHGQATTEIQDNDIFADSNALLFEDDEVDSSPFAPSNSFQPTSYNSFKSTRTGRKSSSIQDELIGSLEQYKNNWLMLQQQQQD
ncbi:LANO_0B05402g1_1 [Lachancea nothofagi CBS 11611]|uniref:non-specific serine/threonine protein kinase n=1 Tax=Lachancea nothofagi CBS 11611 TaxID=1266666 RepID=A0A1G4IYL9_9SACH|nr:LANO_0B05402g1_1 [Lachancea nothofagi CBS 11611]